MSLSFLCLAPTSADLPSQAVFRPQKAGETCPRHRLGAEPQQVPWRVTIYGYGFSVVMPRSIQPEAYSSFLLPISILPSTDHPGTSSARLSFGYVQGRTPYKYAAGFAALYLNERERFYKSRPQKPCLQTPIGHIPVKNTPLK